MTTILPSRRRGPFTRKPLELVLQEEASNSGHSSSDHCVVRHLGLWDLVSIGVGGTVGSGIFVLAGLIAHNYAGPSTFLSFLLSGMAALCSGVCYAEWASRLPAAGSTYVYSLVCLGEWPAVIAGACLTLEYGVSGAAVARSWGDKVIEWLRVEWGWESLATTMYLGGGNDSAWNPLAGLISLLSVILLSIGVQESKNVTNFFTILKVGLVVFMVVGGFWVWDASNLTPLVPMGVSGTLRGATSSFFAYLGYDEVCCLASEARNPTQDMPKAVLWTIGIVTGLYVLASFALVGMVPYDEISETSGFPAAFATRGVVWASQVAAAGEVITLPVVVLISLMAQPRLFAAMASDGLLPKIFQRRDAKGNLFYSNLLCGIPMMLVATFVPFSYLDDSISVGILVAFNMTNTALILMKCNDFRPSTMVTSGPAFRLSRHLVLYHIVAFGTALIPRVMGSATTTRTSWSITSGCLLAPIGYAGYIHSKATKQSHFGAHLLATTESSPLFSSSYITDDTSSSFETPMVPLVPLLGIGINSFLIAQLEWSGLFLLFLYLATVSALYGMYCSRANLAWGHRYDCLGHATTDDDDDGAAILMDVLDRDTSDPDGPILLVQKTNGWSTDQNQKTIGINYC